MVLRPTGRPFDLPQLSHAGTLNEACKGAKSGMMGAAANLSQPQPKPSMDIYDPSMSARFRDLLVARARELGELLHHEADGAGEDPSREVGDYKDAAGQEAMAAVDAAHAAHAGRELEQIRAALKRIEDGSYGECLDCG